MRIGFQVVTRPKKAASAISDETGSSLAACQQAVAKACGYRDWHELEGSLSTSAPPIDIHHPEARIDIEVKIVTEVARQLAANAGDVQYAVSKSRLLGNHRHNMREVLEVRRRLFEANEIPQASRRERGTVGRLRTTGRNGEQVILRSFGRPTKIITHKSANAIVADFEYISPRNAIPLFIPMRLYVPYGMWTEADGAQVLFSRDYKPLWRIREDRAPERVFPWRRISFVEQSWFWQDEGTPWSAPKIYELEMKRLESYRIHAMPILVEALPLVVHRDDVEQFTDAIPILEATFSRRGMT